jgi:arylsulfatase A-like enzyme
VVLILVDDARVDDLSTMPLVRTLIGEAGATFTDATSPVPLCCPARVTLLSGQYAHNHGVLTNKAPQGGFARFNDAETLATWLTPHYTTGLIGKYLNQYVPPYAPPGWDQWMVPVAPYNSRGWRWIVNGKQRSIAGYQTNTVTALATDFIATHADDDQPFFLYASIVAPHISSPPEPDDPKVVYGTSRFSTPNVRDTYRDSFAGMANTNPAFNEADVSDKPRQPPRLEPWEVEALTEVNAQRREAMLSAQDATVNIVDALSSAGALDDTYVFFLSDNGYILGEHRYRGGKLFPYEVSVKVPMLLRGPGIPPGSVVRQTVGLQDFAPTVLAMTNESAGRWPLDGVNLLPMVTDPSLHADRPILLEAAGSSTCSTKEHGYCPFRWHGVLATLDGTRWKYIARGNGFEEMYDLSHDPGELVNVAGHARFADVRSRLAALLTRYQWCAGARCR